MPGLVCSGEWTLSEVARGRKIIKMMFRGNFVSVSTGAGLHFAGAGLSLSRVVLITDRARGARVPPPKSWQQWIIPSFPTSATVIQSILPIFTPMCHRVNPSCLKLGCVSRLWYQQWITQQVPVDNDQCVP